MNAPGPQTILRAIPIVACLAGAWFSGAAAVTGVTRLKAPDQALRIAPDDARALVVRLDRRYAAAPRDVTPATLRATGKRALAAQPLLPAALRQVGLSYAGGRFDERAHPYFALAERMSRREKLSQFWLAGHAIKNEQFDLAARRFDRLFRVSSDAQQLVFPRLDQIVAEPRMQAALARVADRGTPWVRNYLLYLLDNRPDGRAAAGILARLARPAAVGEISSISERLITQLAAAGDTARAAQLFDRMVAARIFTKPTGFFAEVPAITRRSGLPWQLSGTANAAGEWRSGAGTQRSLDVYADVAARMAVATQMRFERPGRYRARVTIKEATVPEGASLELAFVCGKRTPQVVWRFPQGRTGMISGAPFTIAADCPLQLFSLRAIGPESADALEVQVADIALVRSGAS